MKSLKLLNDKEFLRIYAHVQQMKDKLDIEFVQWFVDELNRRQLTFHSGQELNT